MKTADYISFAAFFVPMNKLELDIITFLDYIEGSFYHKSKRGEEIMANKIKSLQVKVTEKRLEHLKKCAKEQDIKLPEYVNEALDFYGAFDVHFLEHIHSTAEKVGLDMPTVIENLLQAYVAVDCANTDTFKTGGSTYRLAFQYDENGLIRGNALSDSIYSTAKKVAERLLEKAIVSSQKREDMYIMNHELAIYASLVTDKGEQEPMRAEA